MQNAAKFKNDFAYNSNVEAEQINERPLKVILYYVLLSLS